MQLLYHTMLSSATKIASHAALKRAGFTTASHGARVCPKPAPRASVLTARRPLSSASPSGNTAASSNSPPKIQKSLAGSGRQGGGIFDFQNRTPVSWTSLFFVGIASASAVAYYRIERERRLETAMGKVVSSESDGWTPSVGYAKRKFIKTEFGWL